jgi:hypothetical protein
VFPGSNFEADIFQRGAISSHDRDFSKRQKGRGHEAPLVCVPLDTVILTEGRKEENASVRQNARAEKNRKETRR